MALKYTLTLGLLPQKYKGKIKEFLMESTPAHRNSNVEASSPRRRRFIFKEKRKNRRQNIVREQ